jgi:hypothetical protein
LPSPISLHTRPDGHVLFGHFNKHDPPSPPQTAAGQPGIVGQGVPEAQRFWGVQPPKSQWKPLVHCTVSEQGVYTIRLQPGLLHELRFQPAARGSHSSVPVRTKPSLQMASLQLGHAPVVLLVPSSHCSMPVRTYVSPHSASLHAFVHAPVLLLLAPRSHSSEPARTPSPQMLVTHAPLMHTRLAEWQSALSRHLQLPWPSHNPVGQDAFSGAFVTPHAPIASQVAVWHGLVGGSQWLAVVHATHLPLPAQTFAQAC